MLAKSRVVVYYLALSFLKELLDLRAVHLVTGVFSRSYHPSFERRLLILAAEPYYLNRPAIQIYRISAYPGNRACISPPSHLLGTTHGVNVVGFRFMLECCAVFEAAGSEQLIDLSQYLRANLTLKRSCLTRERGSYA
jgi:hypothetical protein